MAARAWRLQPHDRSQIEASDKQWSGRFSITLQSQRSRAVVWKGSGNLLTLWEELEGGLLEPTTFHMPAPLAGSPAVMLAELQEPMRAAQTVIVCACATTQGTLVRWAAAVNLQAPCAQRCIGLAADTSEPASPVLSFSSVQVVEAEEPGQIVAAAWASPALCLVGLSDGQLKRVHYQSTHSRPDAAARPTSLPVLVPAARVQVTPVSTSMSAQLWAMFVGGASSAAVRAMATVPLLVQDHTRAIVSVQADGTLQVWDAEAGAAGFSAPLQTVLGSLTGEFDAHEASVVPLLPIEQQGCPWLASTSSQCLVLVQLRLSNGWQRPWLLRLTLGSGGVLRAGTVTVTAVHPDPDSHFWCTSEEQNPTELDGAALQAAALQPSHGDEGEQVQLLTMWLASGSGACNCHAWQHMAPKALSPLLCASPAWTSQAMLAYAASQHALLQRLPASSACAPVAQAVLGSVAAAAVTIQDGLARKPPAELPGPEELVMSLAMPLQWVHDAAAPDAPHAISQVLHAPAAQIVPAGLAAVLQSDDCVRLQSAVWTARWGLDAAVLSALGLPTSSAGAQWLRGPANRLVATPPKLPALHTERRAAGPGIVVLAHALTAAARVAGDVAAHACVLVHCPYDEVCGVLHGAACRAACHQQAQAGSALVALAAFAALPASAWLEHAGLVRLLRAVDVGSAAAAICAVVHQASEALGAAEQPASLRLALAPLQRDQDSNLLDAAPTAAARAMAGAALHSAALGWLEFHASLARGLSAHAAGMQLVPLARHAGLSLLGAPQPLAALEPGPQQLSEGELAQAMWALLPPRVQAALARTQAREALPVLQRSLDSVASNLDALWLRAAQVLHSIAQATVDSSAEDSSAVNPAKAITAIASATMLLLPHRFGAMHAQVDAFSEAAAAFAAQPTDSALATALLARLLQLSAAHDAPLVDEQHWVSSASQQSGPWWHCESLGGPPAWLAIAAVQWMTRCADQYAGVSSLPTAWAMRCVMRLVCTAVQLLLPSTASALPAWVAAAADTEAAAAGHSAGERACPAESAAALACCSTAALHAALLCRARAAGLWWTRAPSARAVQALNLSLNPQVFAGRRSDATWINAAGGADCAEHTLDPLAAPAAAQVQGHSPAQGSDTAQACAAAATVLDAIGSAASVLVFSQGAGSSRSDAGAAPVPVLSSSSLSWGCEGVAPQAQPGTLQPALLMSAMLTLRAQCAVQLDAAPHCAWPPVLRAARAQRVPPMLLVAYADSCAALQPVLVPGQVLTAAQLMAAQAQLYARMLAAQQLGFSSSPAALELAQECVGIAAAAASAMSQAAQHASAAAQAATQGAVQACDALLQQLATAGLCSADGRVSRAQARAIVLGTGVDTALPSVAVPASAVSSHWLLYAGSAAADAASMASTALLLSAPSAPESTAQQRQDLYGSTHLLQAAAQQLLHAALCEPVPLAWDTAWPPAMPHVTLADVSSDAGSPASVAAGAVRLAGLSLTGSIDAFLTACAARACAAAAAGTEEAADVLAPAQALAVSPALWTARYGPCLALAHALAWCSHASSTAQAILTGMSSSHGYSVQAAAAAALLHEATPSTQLHTSALTQALYKATAAGMIAPCTHLLGHLPRTVPLAGSALAEAMLSAIMGIVQDVALEAKALKRAWRRLPAGRTQELAQQCQSMATSALRAHALCETVGVHVPVHSPEYAPLFMASGVAHVAAAALHAAVASPQAPALTVQLAVPCALAALAQLCDGPGSSSQSTAACRTQPAALAYVRGVLREHLGSTGDAVASCLQAACVRVGDAMPASAGAVLGCVAAVTVGRVHEACTALLRFARQDVVHAAPVVTLSVAGVAALAVAIPVALAGPVGLGAPLSSKDDDSLGLADKAGLPAGLVVQWDALIQALACLDSAAAGWPAHLCALHACFVSVPGVEPPAPLLQALCKLRPDMAAVRCAEAGCLQSALYAAARCVPQHSQGTVQYTAAARGGPAAPQLSALRVWRAGSTMIAPGAAPAALPEFAAHAGPVGGGLLACPAWIPWRTVSRVLMAAAQAQVDVQAVQALRGIEASMQAHMCTTASTSNQAAAAEVRAAESGSTH